MMENDIQPPQVIKGNSVREKKGPKDTKKNNPEKPTADTKRKSKQVKKDKKKKIKEKLSRQNTIKPDIFVFDEVAGNKEASALITELVKCYTCNSSLPQQELDLLNKALYEKTISVFLDILNRCIEKIFNKMINMELFKDVLCKKKISKRNAYCQTED